MAKRKKQKKSKAHRKQKAKKLAIKRSHVILNKASEESVPASFSQGELDYYWDIIDEVEEDFLIHHPDNELNYRYSIESLCRTSFSTESVEFFENLYKKAKDVVSRRILAKKIHLLRRAYLQSFKEYSDNALILLTQRACCVKIKCNPRVFMLSNIIRVTIY